jgi:hypothetical protein
MRVMLQSAVLLGFVVALSGCGNPSPEIPKDTVAYDKARDGDPKVIGPGGKEAGAPRKGGGAPAATK